MVAMRLDLDANIDDIIRKLDRIYGSVDKKEILLAEFYGSRQQNDENVSHWSCRLEGIIGFDDVVLIATERTKITEAEIVANEETRYVSEPSSIIDPITWWRESAPTYAIIICLAKKYLAIPAFSVLSERIFSLAGNIVTKKRANLKPDNVDRLSK